MTRHVGTPVRSHRRPMTGWWRSHPRFLRYMLREATALFVTAYALLLLFGLWRLSQGPGAFEAWRAALASPWAVAWHALSALMLGYHTLTWFQVLPKTIPESKLPPRTVPTVRWPSRCTRWASWRCWR
jgi:fumarate reductase subunit C